MPPSSTELEKRDLRVLILEDQANDADLVIDELKQAGFAPDWRRVENEADFLAALEPEPDIILADYSLPRFDGLRALALVRERRLDIPFIIVSGSLGDELAAQCIRQGAADYLLKDRLQRLGHAVSTALEEKRLRQERRQMEAQLQQAQKMQAIGHLAGGIAHDFNNLLTVINGYVGFLLETEALSPKASDALRRVYAAGEQAVGLTRQLLYFSRKRPIQTKALDLNEIIDNVAEILQRLLGEHIELKRSLAQGLPPIGADETMVEQVIMNLAVNARDAMERGGKITIGTRSIEIPESELPRRPGAAAGSFVCLSVKDTGTGIPPDVLPNIFEPLFTTKEEGQGTGLGLATVATIVKQHKGWIEVDTKLGEGTTFTIFFPSAIRSASAGVPEAANAGSGKGTETILVVEDEASVREFAVAVLQESGYRVLQARSGRQALEVWKWHADRISLVLTDLVMPDDLTGAELAADLRSKKPSLAVVFTSGYSSETIPRALAPGRDVRFLTKPYSPKVLANVVRAALDAVQRSADS